MEKNQKIMAWLKSAEITDTQLKEKNLSRLHRASNSFSFQKRPVIYFYTLILKGPEDYPNFSKAEKRRKYVSSFKV